MTTFESIVRKQQDLHYRICRAVDNLKKTGKEKITQYLLDARIQLLDSNWEKFFNTHELLISNQTEELKSQEYFKGDFYSSCEDAYLGAKAEMLQMRELAAASQSARFEASCHDGDAFRSHSSIARSLPKISLPKFAGDYQSWPSFRDLFRSMIGENSDIAAVEKLHYLKSNVSGEAARLIANVPVTAGEFTRAWDTLVSRYENKRVLISAYLDQLFALAPITRKSASDLKELISTIKESLGGLKALGAPTESWDLFLVYFVTRRLDADSREAWELKQGSTTEPASFHDLDVFLDGRVRALEVIAPGNSTKTRISKFQPSRLHARSNIASASFNNNKCAVCGSSHYISSCPDFSAKSSDDRREVVISKRLCFNCLGAHRLSECRSTKRCRLCGGHHHTLIHRAPGDSGTGAVPGKSTTSMVAPAALSSASALDPTANAFHVSVDSTNSRPLTVLATARVKILRDCGQFLEARALLDQGSELSFVRESLAQALRLPRQRASVPILGIGSRPAYTTRGILALQLQSCYDSTVNFTVNAYVLPRLTGRVPACEVPSSSWEHLQDLTLADPTFGTPGHIDLVLGADIYGQLLSGPIRQGVYNQMIAQETTLGWVISGPATEHAVGQNSSHSLCGTPDHELNELLCQFWKQEELTSPNPSTLNEEETQCEDHFRRTHSRSSSGRYIVRLPFRESTSLLGHSRLFAERSLRRLHHRFSANPELSRLYADFLREYESLGHMAKAPPVGINDGPVFFLPHHGILRPSRTSSKLRVVFNGSARSSTGVSLNDCLHIGPKLHRDLADILLRWRCYSFVFLADVEKMYRQIQVHPADRNFQRILWSQDKGLEEYQLCTVTYGLSCAPFLALRVMLQLAEDEGPRFPDAAAILRQEMYVDDVLSGADTLSVAKIKAAQLDKLLMAGGFQLHKWMANHPTVLSDVTRSPLQSTGVRELSFDALPRALGLAWDPSTDSFVFRFKPPTPCDILTKRVVLSRVAQMFDPLGWITPVLIMAKIFIQGLWKLQIGWDQPLPPLWSQRWRDFEAELSAVSSITIPRWLGSRPSSAMEFHGFSDASNDALGAVLYLRSISSDNTVAITLIAGKSKVAPLKRMTIPRLELSAAVLLARLLARSRQVLQFDHVPAHLWTDSSVVLAWLKGHPSRWKDFVSNRVAAIHETAPDVHWHHVPGVDNPADCASRGLFPQSFLSHHLWWSGPSWLNSLNTSWETIPPPLDPGVNLEERPSSAHLTTSPPPGAVWDLAFRYSKLSRLLRTTAWVSRAASRFKSVTPSNHMSALSPQELAAAEIFWVRQTQQAHFPMELSALSRGAPLPRTHPFLRLTPFLDSDGILRIGGRLRNSQLDPDAKHPILLPRDAVLSHLIIDDVHSRTLHGGVQLVLASLRRKFWILGGRAPVSAFNRRCVRCARYRASAAKELMGQLPPSRVVPARPFLNSGVDYAGPFHIKAWRGRGNRSYKAFLVIFVCMATSAVHLELATDYSTAGFIAAFKRFCARRGICATLTSDCGTNLVGADAELRRLFSSSSREIGVLANQLASDGTHWRFNPPSAPHFGGKWEAAVKSTKFHLRRVVGDTCLTYEEFATVLTQVEAVLNSRPLCQISDDPADTEALTPGHFLIGEAFSVIPEPSLADIPVTKLSRWQQLRQMTEHFWKRWSTEYLQRLQDVAKWQHPSRQIKLGSLVLIRDERYPPAKWPLARVVETHAGTDGLVRVVTVRTSASVFKRPITKLCPLPIIV